MQTYIIKIIYIKVNFLIFSLFNLFYYLFLLILIIEKMAIYYVALPRGIRYHDAKVEIKACDPEC